MYTRVEVVEQAEFDRWLEQAAEAEPAELGRSEWEAACAKCHGLDGEGDVGPAIAGNGTLINRQGLIRLLSEGQDTADVDGYMPPVGLGWSGAQYDALVAYVRSNERLAPQTGGGG
jgi:mono/diheme cytochrome c family protein